MNLDENQLPYWLNLKQTSQLLQVSESTLKRQCAAGRIAPQCGRQFGKLWRFKRDVLLEDGLILIGDPDRQPEPGRMNPS